MTKKDKELQGTGMQGTGLEGSGMQIMQGIQETAVFGANGAVIHLPNTPKYEQWLAVYEANYRGTSDIAKSLSESLKKTYKGMSYLPWATMERVVYMLDPKAKFTKVRNELGGFVHTDRQTVFTKKVKGDSTETTEITVLSHMVVVELVFMGILFEEVYPVQDNMNDAPKVYDQNIINRSLQRATARLASRATGLGLSLYENGELPEPEELKKEQPKVEPKEMPTANTDEPNGSTITAETVLTMLRTFADKDKMNSALADLDTQLTRNFGFVLRLEDSDEEILKKISNFKSMDNFVNSLNRKLGVS